MPQSKFGNTQPQLLIAFITPAIPGDKGTSRRTRPLSGSLGGFRAVFVSRIEKHETSDHIISGNPEGGSY